MKPQLTDGASVLARWGYEGKIKSVRMRREKRALTATTAAVARQSAKSDKKISEAALDEAIENTFPGSDPVSSEQPV